MTLRSAATTGVLLASLAGCGESTAPDGATATVQDSAGIRLVTNGGPLRGESRTPALLWAHGHGPEDYAFQNIFAGALQPTGAAVVSDGGNREIVLVDPTDGARLLAETGEGPTEVSRPRQVLVDPSGDVWIEDAGNGKILHLRGDDPPRMINTSLNPALAFGAMPVGVTSAGELLMVTASYRSDFEVDWLDGHLTRLPPDGTLLDSVGVYPMAPRMSESGMNPWGAYGWATVAGEEWVHARTDIPEVRWTDSEGRLRQVVRWARELAYPTEEMWEEFEQAMLVNLVRVNPQMSRARAEEFAQQQLQRYSLDTSEPLPLFAQVVGGAGGEVWLPRYERRGYASHAFFVISNDGTEVLEVAFDRAVTVLDSRDGHVLVQLTDDFDVQAVAVYAYEED